MKRNLQTIFVIISNIYPLFGLLYLHWDPFYTSLIFIIETLVILLFFELKILAKIFAGIFSDLFAGIFIIIPIGVFCFVHYIASVFLFLDDNSLSLPKLLIWILILFLSYGIDFLDYIQNKEYTKRQSRELEKIVRGISIRLFLMQATVLIGGVIATISKNKALGVSILLILQIGINLVHYFRIKKPTDLPLLNQ